MSPSTASRTDDHSRNQEDDSQKMVVEPPNPDAATGTNEKATGADLQQAANKKISHLEGRLSEMEEVQNTTLNELEKEQFSASLAKDSASGRIRDLEIRLLEEQVKSRRLEQKLTPFLLAAVAEGTL